MGPENLAGIEPQGQKLFYFVAVTDILNPPTPTRENFLLNLLSMGNLKPCKISTNSLCEARFTHITREG